MLQPDVSGTPKRIVCLGELLLRLTAPRRELLLQNGLLEVHVGGSEANVAVGLACLGHETAVISRVPDNALGDAAVGHLRRYGVSVEGVSRGHGRMGLYFMSVGAGQRASSIIYDREGSSFALAGRGDFDFDRSLDGAGLLHLSGITPALGPDSAAVALACVEAARSRGVPISFDMNFRSQLWQRWDSAPRAILHQFVEKAQILFGNHRDISLLLGKEFSGEGDGSRRQAAEAAFDAYPNLQLIASTARCAEDADRHRIAARVDWREGAFQSEEIATTGIVDRIGSGDAFAAGVLHGVLGGAGNEQSVGYGLALACLKHSLPGDASLFTQADIDSFLAREFDVRR